MSRLNEVSVRKYCRKDFFRVMRLLLQSNFPMLSYEDVEDGFSELLAVDPEKNYDPYDYFTVAKQLWIAENEEGEVIGIISLHFKCDGSVEIYKLVIAEYYPDSVRENSARKLIETLMQAAATKKIRKIYCTVPSQTPGITDLLSSFGFICDSYLKEREKEATEVVCSWFPNGKIQSANGILVREMENKDAETVYRIINGYLHKFYKDTEVFVQRMIENYPPKDIFRPSERYKVIFVAEKEGRILGLLASAPQRSGGIRFFPFPVPSLDVEKALLEYAIDRFSKERIYKISSSLPAIETERFYLYLGLGFKTEGVLFEPHKPGVNEIILEKIINPKER